MKKKSKKTTGEVDVRKEVAERLGEATANYFDRMAMDMLMLPSLLFSGKYRNQRVPKYLRIRIPVIERHYCYNDDGDSGGSGLLLTTREIRLFKIGTEIIKVPVMRNFKKGETITFKRYSTLNKKTDKLTLGSKQEDKVLHPLSKHSS